MEPVRRRFRNGMEFPAFWAEGFDIHLFVAIHFIADDQGIFSTHVGLVFDATALLGAPRSKVRTFPGYCTA